jgi:hypothetical protein
VTKQNARALVGAGFTSPFEKESSMTVAAATVSDSSTPTQPPVLPADAGKPNGAPAAAVAQPALLPWSADAPENVKRLKAIGKLGKEIDAQKRDIGKQETRVATAESALKTERGKLNELNHELDELQDDLNALALGKFPERLFPRPKPTPVSAAAPAAAAAPPSDDGAWRKVPLSELTPKIPDKKITLLFGNEPNISTLGELVDWIQAKGDPWWWKDVKGLGEKGRDAITDATDAFWSTRPQYKPAPAEAEAVPVADAMPKKRGKGKGKGKKSRR